MMSPDALRLLTPPADTPSPVTTRVPLLDIAREMAELRPAIDAAISTVLDSTKFVLGPEVAALEGEVANLCGATQGVGCASGSDALLLALMALEVGPGDEVVVPSFTFFATASAISRLGATPVFVDIEPSTFNLCPASVANAMTEKTRAIIPVHLFGQCADMPAICSLATESGVAVIEDAAQAIGAHLCGRPAGSWGQVTCFSFYPTKNLGGCGDGGMLVTSDEGLAERLRLLRVHGMCPRYYHQVVGINSRLDTLQAAILRVKLQHLERWTIRRQGHAAGYHELFTAVGLDRVLGLPVAAEPLEHVWNQYTIRVPDGRRDALRQHLSAANVGSEVYYPIPLHRQACFAHLQHDALPHTETAAREVLSLPVFPAMTPGERDFVVRKIRDFF